MAALQKVYPCLSCGQEIRLERKDNKWLRWNLDGTPHIDEKKQQQQKTKPQPTITSSASKAAQTPVVTSTSSSSVERKLDHLIAEVQALRMELQGLQKKK